MRRFELNESDMELVKAAREVLERNYKKGRHTKGAAVRAPSGKIYCGINVEGCAYGPCAEAIALGAALTGGEGTVNTVVTVRKREERFPVVPPCGTCRQLLVDYAPQAFVILAEGEKLYKVPVRELLPESYLTGL